MQVSPRSTVRFGDFALDLSTGELSSNGDKAYLQEKPFQILCVLLGRPGELVTREELVKHLWPDGTFVDFDQSLNKAVNRLREALADSAEEPKFIETLPRRGYRFIAPVQTLAEDSPNNEPNGATQNPRPIAPRSSKVKVAAGALGLTVAIAGWLVWRIARNDHTSSMIRSIAVLPLENLSGDATQDYFADGMTDELITNLGQIGSIRVISRTSVMQYKGVRKSLPQIARELGVDAVVEGTVLRSGEQVRITAQLVQASTEQHLWAHSYQGDIRDVLGLQSQVASAIASEIRIKLTSQQQAALKSARVVRPEAYELYMRGLYFWNKRTLSDIATAISYFNQAVAKDPSFALAYSGLADAYSVLPGHGGTPNEDYPKSNAAARKALELDATLAHPHAVLGANEMKYDWDFAGGEAEYHKALELDPNDATAHQWYAEAIAVMGGREQEALAEINRAQQLDPLSPIIIAQSGLVHIMARRFDEAILVCTKLANENQKFAVVHAYLAQAYWEKRMYPPAIEEWKVYGQLSGNRNESEFASAMEQGFRSAGWKGALARGIDVRQAQRKTGYSSAYRIAQNYADLGNKDQAFRWLNTAYRERDLYLLALNTDFLLDPLRSDSRFAELVRKVGLPQ